MTAELHEPRDMGAGLPSGATQAAKASPERASWLASDQFATVVVIAVIVVLMQIGSAFIPAYILPSPISVVRSLFESLVTTYDQILITILRLIISLLVSIAVGTADRDHHRHYCLGAALSARAASISTPAFRRCR